MDTFLSVVTLLGGLAMFLYGMEIMGDGLKNGSGPALKKFLGKLTHNIFLGLITGTIVTAIIQSSTATIVLTVGLIGAGILNLRQAVSVVMGANIGTTVTAQIIRLMDIDSSGNAILELFKPTTLAPIALIIGILLIMFVKKGNSKNVGMIAMGFGILFIGLDFMTEAVKPLAESDVFKNVIEYFGNMPIMGIIIGLVFTVIIQSSSAAVGILQTLASSTGIIDFNIVYPIIMGINLGTCVTTAMVCSIGTGKDAKRAGIVHILFNTIGTVVFMIAMTLLQKSGAFPTLWGSYVDSGAIANFQTVFNLITAIILLPFTGLLVKASCKIIRDDATVEDKYPELAALDTKLMISPAVALDGVNKGFVAMAKAARDNLALGIAQLANYDESVSEVISACENRLDSFADSADNYLIDLSRKVENEHENRQLNMLMQCIPDIERIGDYATNFDELAAKMKAEQRAFSDNAKAELKIMNDAVIEIMNLTVEAIEKDSENAARRIEPLEEVIDDMVLVLRDRHAARLREGVCVVDSGLIFLEALTHLERAADQCSSIALQLLGKNNADIMKNHHRYLTELHNSGERSYVEEQEMRRAQYLVALENIGM
ncbi:MAG: Na/Pi cotransporter family protein [Oscillospiraceae bacterium]|nr:Na/Pi cotransporter family protein [Oscillospiraceae bacterium]